MSEIEVTPTPTPKKQFKITGVSGFVTGLLVATSLMFIANKYVGLQQSPKFVVVDSAAIIGQVVQKFANDQKLSAVNAEQTIKAAKDVSMKLHDALQGYANKGYLVINKRALLGFPPDTDKTNEIALAVGVTMPESK